MVRVRLLALVVFLSSCSFGQTLVYTRTVQGNLFLPPGTPAQNSRMRFQLKYCQGGNGRVPVNPGNPPGPTGIIVSSAPFDVTVQSDGSWRTQVYGNDQIVCGSDRTGPSRWLVQPVFNGEAGTGVEYQIQSCGAASPCNPFLPDSAPRCSLTIVTDCAVENGNPDQPDTTVTINAVMAVPNAYNFGNVLLPPANGTLINFMQNGNQAGAYLPGNGNSATCLSGTGSWVLCGGGGAGGGVSGATAGGGLVLSGSTLGMIRTCTTNQYLSWNGSAWICTTLSGGGGGGSGLPTTPQYDLFTSTGSGGGQASGILGGSGFLKGQVILATGDVTSAAAPFPLAPNASVEYFPTGATFGGLTLGTTNGLAAYFSHSGKSGVAPGFGNGGLILGGGNNSGTNYQVYLDCESAPALNCDFKVPLTVNGAGAGGGGGGGLPTIPAPNLYASNGAAAAVDSGVLGQGGFLRAYVLEATGTGSASPFTVPNGSVEYFPAGASYGGLNIGTAHGVSIYFSHSSGSGQAANGGVALGGGNSSGAANSYQIYLDCEQATGCDFKVPPTYNGTSLGGGGAIWGSITGTLSSQTDLQSALNSKLSTTGTAASASALAATPTLCTAGQVAAGILANGNATGCTPVGAGSITGATANGGLLQTGTTLGLLNTCTSNQVLAWNGSAWACAANGTTPPANQTVSFSNALTATLTSTTSALVWSCYDTSTPANAIYPSNVSVDPTTFLVTFNFAVQQTGTCVVNSSGGGGGGGGGGTITGVTPSQGLAVTGTTIGLQSCAANQILQSAGTTWGCIATPTGGGGGSGTVNSGTGGHFTWYSATGTIVSSNPNLDDDATSPSTITSQEIIAAPQVNINGAVGTGIAMTGAGGTLPAATAGQGGIGIGPGNVPMYTSNGGAWTAIGGAASSIVSCMPAADLLTFTARTNVCTLALPAGTAKQWIVVCSLIWNRQNDGTAASTITARLNLNNAPTSLSYFTTETWASGGPVFGNIQVAAAAGDTQFVAPSSANGDLTIWSFVFRGTIMAPTAGENAVFSMQSSNGTGAIRLGSYCTAQ